MMLKNLLFCVFAALSAAAGSSLNESVFSLPHDALMYVPDGEGRPHLVDLSQQGPDIFVNGERDVSFHLYTSINPTNPVNILIGNRTALSNMDLKQETKLLIHGWNSKGQSMRHVKRAYVELGEENVVVVDWSRPASGLYSSSRRATRQVGAYVARFLDFLSRSGVDLAKVHLVGHSLGAHVAGIAGHRVSAGRVARITGLDPAAPGYGGEALENRLDASDADQVQVLHTNAGLLGWSSPLGHLDFYPNGGKKQPGCGMDIVGTCSHSRAHWFFAESVNSPVGFWGVRCASWDDYRRGRCHDNERALMGSRPDHRSQGSFYLTTGASEPFARGYY
ncbi:pancreatic lipase-related protein 2-like [Bacillus rossius redtenbacheri]|uniref:pancreatic lipase-related protein 2-like n=1 Tax=Bacillus rossius redtenbacheri TaxID=93214 RepID=UPI002FDEADFD